MNNKLTTRKKTKGKKKENLYAWGFFVLFLSFFLTVFFSYLSELCVSDSSVLVGVLVLFVLLVLNISSDVLANAVLSCPVPLFLSMASQKVKGAKRAVSMCRNAPKLGSIFADVIGDICGIVSGSISAALVVKIMALGADVPEIVWSILISAVIGALTVGGKAIFKVFAVKYNTKIVFFVARLTSFLVKEK